MVEGAVERLVLPTMIKLEAAPGLVLTQSFISVVEVGGAYAHVFKDFLNFLQVPTLIITDLDATDGERKNRVDPASYLAGPPTDPDVRISRIRLFEAQIRCATQMAWTIRGRGRG
jgi:predicted ATP-dependent endonuclease of OLD family